MVLTHHRFRTSCTPMRRHISPGLPLLQYYTVRRAMRPPSSVTLVHPINHSRDCRHSILPMYERAFIPRPSYNERRPVGACGPHRYGVLVYDNRVCDKPRHFLDVLHQRPRVHWYHPRTHRICDLWLPGSASYQFSLLSYVPLEPMVSRWASG